MDKLFPVKNRVIIEKIENSYLVMLEDNVDTSIFLSDLSAEIFDMCDAKQTVQDIISQIFNNYDVTYEECANDVKECLKKMADSNIIKLIKGGEE